MTQAEALAILESGQSALLTGAAGSGKTYLLNRFISRAKRSGRSVAVTATTGLAATHLGGSTIHAWSGIGIHDRLPPGYTNNFSLQRRKLIGQADVLVIDEISMLHDFRLDIVEQVCREVRMDPKPFGGLQVILCGDFFQLPPINRPTNREGGFITNSASWQNGGFTVLYMQEQHRQNSDDKFANILNALRNDQLEENHLADLNNRIGAWENEHLTPTNLHTTNLDVDAINQGHLDQLRGPEKQYQLGTSGKANYVESLKRSCLAPELLSLKVGALVMCIKNSLDKKYVNGSMGIVVGFEEETGYPEVRLSDGKELIIRPDTWELRDGDVKRAQLTQLPLRLAWAITVHKSQGMTLDAAKVDLRRAFAPGMGYVALSRVRRLEDLTLVGLNNTALQVSPEALSIDAELREASGRALRNNADLLANAQQIWESPDVVKIEDEAEEEGSWTDKLTIMRQSYPNAYRPWSSEDDIKLRDLFTKNHGLKALTTTFGRHPGSIRSRIRKHFGEEAIIKA